MFMQLGTHDLFLQHVREIHVSIDVSVLFAFLLTAEKNLCHNMVSSCEGFDIYCIFML